MIESVGMKDKDSMIYIKRSMPKARRFKRAPISGIYMECVRAHACGIFRSMLIRSCDNDILEYIALGCEEFISMSKNKIAK
jgi:putative heme iron utilization protein